MQKKSDKDKLINIAAKVLSVPPATLKQALENALDVSILKRDNEMLKALIDNERKQHENEIQELKRQIRR